MKLITGQTLSASIILMASAITSASFAQEPTVSTMVDPALEAYGLSKGAALVLPISALAVPEVAESVTPIVINPETGIAMEGFDPVGFFTEGKAMKGDKNFMAEFQGAMFLFASAENRDLFIANPEKFAPAYGGYCTQTIAAGKLTPASPVNWTIHGDRLFFTRSPEANEAFRAERENVIKSGDRYWADAKSAFLTGVDASAHQD